MSLMKSVCCAWARTDGRSHHPSLNFFAPLFCFKTKKWKTSALRGSEKKENLQPKWKILPLGETEKRNELAKKKHPVPMEWNYTKHSHSRLTIHHSRLCPLLIIP
jgi:hypothetical protein